MHQSLPRDLFFEDAVACMGKQVVGPSELEELRSKVSAECALRLRPRNRLREALVEMSTSGTHAPACAQNTVASLLDGCFETGVCTGSPGWILLKFARSRLITKLHVSGYHGNCGFSAANGRGAIVEFSTDSSNYTVCGSIPSIFGAEMQLYEVPLNEPVIAKYLRFKKSSFIGISQVALQ